MLNYQISSLERKSDIVRVLFSMRQGNFIDIPYDPDRNIPAHQQYVSTEYQPTITMNFNADMSDADIFTLLDTYIQNIAISINEIIING